MLELKNNDIFKSNIIMDKYGRVLIIIFFLCLINLGLILFTINKLDARNIQTGQTENVFVKQSPIPTNKPSSVAPDDIRSDLNLIKAEVRALREILGVTGSFEELSNIVKGLNNNE